MSMFVAPLFVLLVALGFSARIVVLQGRGVEIPKLVASARYAVWAFFGFSLALVVLQSGLI